LFSREFSLIVLVSQFVKFGRRRFFIRLSVGWRWSNPLSCHVFMPLSDCHSRCLWRVVTVQGCARNLLSQYRDETETKPLQLPPRLWPRRVLNTTNVN